MLRKKLRESLTARIFLLTFGMLLAASAVTFGFIAWATPMTYVSVVSDELNQEATALANKLEPGTCDYDTMVGLAGDLASRTGASVTIVSPAGDVLMLSFEVVSESPLSAAATVTEQFADAESVAVAPAPGTGDVSTVKEDENSALVYTVTTDAAYPFALADRAGIYSFSVSPSTQRVNQTVQALAQVAPWLLCAMALFSLLCAFGYSRYISRPILRLSAISQKMAALDFGWAYGENRLDEIGDLGRNLNSLSRSLAAALGELRGANEALQRDIALERELEQQRLAFFSAASHELKTPVTILKGQLTGMLEGVDVYRDRDKYLARSLQVTGRMEHLVQELLTISRMEAADFSARMQPLDLARLLRLQLPLYTELAGQKGLTIQTDIPETLPLTGDDTLLRKALDSILSNAVLYSPPGETVVIWAGQQDGQTVLTVENGGVQLPPDALPHLFEAFYRVEQSRNRSTGGSGLGLYLTARILSRHGAACTMENTTIGVRFTARFPSENSTQTT